MSRRRNKKPFKLDLCSIRDAERRIHGLLFLVAPAHSAIALRPGRSFRKVVDAGVSQIFRLGQDRGSFFLFAWGYHLMAPENCRLRPRISSASFCSSLSLNGLVHAATFSGTRGQGRGRGAPGRGRKTGRADRRTEFGSFRVCGRGFVFSRALWSPGSSFLIPRSVPSSDFFRLWGEASVVS